MTRGTDRQTDRQADRRRYDASRKHTKLAWSANIQRKRRKRRSGGSLYLHKGVGASLSCLSVCLSGCLAHRSAHHVSSLLSSPLLCSTLLSGRMCTSHPSPPLSLCHTNECLEFHPFVRSLLFVRSCHITNTHTHTHVCNAHSHHSLFIHSLTHSHDD